MLVRSLDLQNASQLMLLTVFLVHIFLLLFIADLSPTILVGKVLRSTAILEIKDKPSSDYDSWDVRLRNASLINAPWQHVVIVPTQTHRGGAAFLVPSLQANTLYEIRIRRVTGSHASSPFSRITTFRTLMKGTCVRKSQWQCTSLRGL